ncbi:hypothetical protein GCM10023156_20170 [Novipirellula rosea]|uniref:Uncharacterized protein n=1 Tax=Novipirellula rosea TaxID=1031540 RepID=A0ABP8MLB1_9BACT
MERGLLSHRLQGIRVKWVPTKAVDDVDAADLRSRGSQRMGEVKVVVEPVTEIKLTKAGKFMAVINLTSKQSNASTGASEYVDH